MWPYGSASFDEMRDGRDIGWKKILFIATSDSSGAVNKGLASLEHSIDGLAIIEISLDDLNSNVF